jgi:hypothetical protein
MSCILADPTIGLVAEAGTRCGAPVALRLLA